MAVLGLTSRSHRRLNVLTGEWVLVSPYRAHRPWQGRVEVLPDDRQQPYDPSCYLCPGNKRANGETNPKYENTFVFTNDFSALVPVASESEHREKDLLVASIEPGTCRVVCFSPRHDLSLAEMEVTGIRSVVDVWVREYEELGTRPEIQHVQIFENKGQLMGCSNPHPHGQIWAQHSIPSEPAKEILHMKEYLQSHHACLLCDYVAVELQKQERIVFVNDDIVIVVPFWAVWPFETIVLPKRHVSSLIELTAHERTSLADALKRMTTRYDNLFQISFPYSAGFHQSPTDGRSHSECHLHLHFFPPLLRSASIKKFMVGYEMLANPQRDVTPESSAEQLRILSDVHYRKEQFTVSQKS